MNTTPITLPKQPQDRLDLATRHIEENLLADLSVAELADVAGLSEFHFSRQFSARFGQSAIAFVRARRMQIAARALATGDDLRFGRARRRDGEASLTQTPLRRISAPFRRRCCLAPSTGTTPLT